MASEPELLRLVAAGYVMLVLPGDAPLEPVLVRREDLPAFGVGNPVALALADLATLHAGLAKLYPVDGVFNSATVKQLTGLAEAGLERWLRWGWLPWSYPPAKKNAGGCGRRFAYVDLMGAALLAAMRQSAYPPPGAIMRALAAFFERPRTWEPEQTRRFVATAAR